MSIEAGDVALSFQPNRLPAFEDERLKVDRMSQHDWSWTSRKALPSNVGAHIPYVEEILHELTARGWEGRDLFGIRMALEESLSNAIRHGNCCDASKDVNVECKLNSERFWLQVRDEGRGFRPDVVPDCTAEENLECPGGRGLALIKAYMTRVEHNKAGNCVTMEKIRSAASANPAGRRSCEPDRSTQK